MLHHIALCASSLQKSSAFFDEVLSHLDYKRVLSLEHLSAWEGPGPEILLYQAHETQIAREHRTYDPGIHHLAFHAKSRKVVNDISAKLQSIGATILHPPQTYPNYSDGYYAVFFLDPDGVKLEVMTEENE
jgi:glyoxylase I family protein